MYLLIVHNKRTGERTPALFEDERAFLQAVDSYDGVGMLSVAAWGLDQASNTWVPVRHPALSGE